MKMLNIPFLAGLALLPTGIFAQDSAADIHALAEKYVNLPSVQLMFDDQFSAQNMAIQFSNGLPDTVQLSDDQLARIGDIFAAGMTSIRPTLSRVMIDGLSEGFSADELHALITFYESELGASVMRKMTPFMQDIMGQIFPDMQRMQEAVLPGIIAIIQE